jgi:hypothetical protein
MLATSNLPDSFVSFELTNFSTSKFQVVLLRFQGLKPYACCSQEFRKPLLHKNFAAFVHLHEGYLLHSLNTNHVRRLGSKRLLD